MPEFNEFPEVVEDDPPPAWLLEMVRIDQELRLDDGTPNPMIKEDKDHA